MAPSLFLMEEGARPPRARRVRASVGVLSFADPAAACEGETQPGFDLATHSRRSLFLFFVRVLVLEDDQDEHHGVEEHEDGDAYARPGGFLVLLGAFDLDDALAGVLGDLFHVEVDAVEDGALVDDEDGEFLEDGGEFLDGLGYLADFVVALGDERLDVGDGGELLLGEAGRDGLLGGGPAQEVEGGVGGAVLLALESREVLLLALAEVAVEALDAHGDRALDVRSNRAFRVGEVVVGAARDPLERGLARTEETGRVPRLRLDLRVQRLLRVVERHHQPLRVQRLQLARRLLDLPHRLLHLVHQVDPDRRQRGRLRGPRFHVRRLAHVSQRQRLLLA
mmetsp:Transcript_9280/g.29501  ORF Transcript_9280/g.29501 Transcript_9280/m.29501 type:complete len:337 (-) Transcript_9280:156-1166(-)